MKKSIYDYQDYKKYLNDLIASYPHEGRGMKTSLAESIQCQKTFITHVLSGDYHFSQEQCEAAARFFGLSKNETEFLFLLLNENRAGTESLRTFFKTQIREKKEQHSLLKTRLKIKNTLDREAQASYYSHWRYAAVHMITTIAAFQTREAISKHLSLSLQIVTQTLDFLVSKGLLVKTQNKYVPSSTLLHLEQNSPFLPSHHTQWRLKTIDSLEKKKAQDLHYSLVFSCSIKDLPKIRESLTRCLEECSETIKPSKEETLATLCLDFYEL